MMKKILPFLFLMILISVPAQAQEGPTEGAACTTAGVMARAGGPEITSPNGGNWLICNGSNWIMAWNFGRDARSQVQFDYDTGSCTSLKTGRIRYNSSTNIWDYCNGIGWTTFARQGAASDCNYWGQAPGYVCPDGTVFAGFASGANYKALFTTRCDAGQTWNGSACSGTRTTRAWNNGNTSGYTDISGALQSDGAANTLLLISSDSNSGAGGTQPHQAAQYCADLVLHGQSDWFLPSTDELFLLRTYQTAIGGFSASDYWASSQGWLENGKVLEFGGAAGTIDLAKQTAYYVRCVRG